MRTKTVTSRSARISSAQLVEVCSRHAWVARADDHASNLNVIDSFIDSCVRMRRTRYISLAAIGQTGTEFVKHVVRLIRRCGNPPELRPYLRRHLQVASPNSVPPRGEFHLLFFSVFLLLIYADCNRATRENTLCRKTWQPCRDQGIMGIISWLASSTWGHPPHPVTCQLQFMRFVANLLRICCLQSWQQFGIRLIISPVSFTVIYLNDMQTDVFMSFCA